MKRHINLRLISIICTAIFFSFAFFFAYPMNFYASLLKSLDLYYSQSFCLAVSAAVYLCAFAGVLILVYSIHKHSQNRKSVEDLTATNLALQGFITPASMTLRLQEYALTPHTIVSGTGGLFVLLCLSILLLVNLVLLATAVILHMHIKRASSVGQFAIVLALACMLVLGSWLPLIFVIPSVMLLYHLSKRRD